MKIKTYEDAAGEFRWSAVSANGRIVADCAEGYTRREDAIRAAAMVRREIADAPIEGIDDGPQEEPS